MVVRPLLLPIWPTIEAIVPLVSKVMVTKVVVDGDNYYH